MAKNPLLRSGAHFFATDEPRFDFSTGQYRLER